VVLLDGRRALEAVQSPNLFPVAPVEELRCVEVIVPDASPGKGTPGGRFQRGCKVDDDEERVVRKALA
jgi:hypothetical protein